MTSHNPTIARALLLPLLARRRLVAAAGMLVLAAWVVAVRWVSFDVSSSDADESLFLLIGGRWLNGHLPYADIWDVKPPGLFAIFALAQRAFGPGILAARILSALAVFTTSLALHRFARRHLGGKSVAIAAAGIYPAYSLILYGLRSRPEMLLAPLVVLGLDLAVREWRRGSREAATSRVVVAGLLFGAAVMIKQTAIFEAILAAGLLSTRSAGAPGSRRFDLRAFVLFGIAGALPTFGFLAYFALSGVEPALYLAPFVGASHRLGGDGITFVGGALRFLPMLKPIVPLFFGFLLFCTEWRPLRASGQADGCRALALWVFASAAGIIAMRSMYFQYMQPLVPPFLLASLVVIRLFALRIERAQIRPLVVAGSCLVLAVYPMLWLVFSERENAGWSPLPAKVVAHLQALGLQPSDSLYVPDQETTLYLLAGARIPTRFPQAQHLVCDFTLPDTDQAAEIHRIMAGAPRFVLVSHQRPWMACERPDRLAIVDAALALGYDREATIAEGGAAIDVYCRTGACPASPRSLAPGPLP